MEDNDISPFLAGHIACWFEGLLATLEDVPEKRGWFRRNKVAEDEQVDQFIRRHRANELPMKSLVHIVNKLGIAVEVYTYYGSEYTEAIETWLGRKGVSCIVYSYTDVFDLREDLKYNRDVQTLYTPFEEDAKWLFPRATVVSPDSTWGF